MASWVDPQMRPAVRAIPCFRTLFASTALLCSGFAIGQASVDSRIFEGVSTAEPVSLLVVLRDQADLSGARFIRDRSARTRFVFEALREQAEVSQAGLRARLSEAGVAHRPFWVANMIEVRADRALAEELAARPEVARIAANRDFGRPPNPTPLPVDLAVPEGALRSSSALVEPNIDRIGAATLWDLGVTGQGMVVGLADTGVSWEHPDIRARYRGVSGQTVSHDYNWHDAIHAAVPTNICGSNTPAPCDDNGHGTAVTSLAVGEGGIGVAPGARWIGCRNMDANFGSPARYTECFQFFLAPTDRAGANPRPDLAPHVVNNSWGCPVSEGCTDPDVLRAVIENVQAAGIVVVVAAGNEGPACSTVVDVPAFYEASFSIGATTLSDGIASFSSRGPVTIPGHPTMKPDMTAPGVSVLASVSGGGRNAVSGTSAAAPHVSGAVALLWSGLPLFEGEVTATRLLLQATAQPLLSTQCGGGVLPNAVFGWGRLDVAASYFALVPSQRAAPLAPPRREGVPRSLGPRN